MKTSDTINGKTPEKIKKGLECHSRVSNCDTKCYKCDCFIPGFYGKEVYSAALAYIQQLESSRWELFEELSTAYYGKQMYGLNDDGTVYSRYSCDTMSFEQAVDEFRRLIADE